MSPRSRIAFLVSLLLVGSAGPSLASDDDIHRLIEKGDTEKAKALLAKAPDLVRARNFHYKETPLHVAAHHGRVDLVKYLLEHGADVNARAYNDFTPLCLTQDPDVVKLLIEYKADLDVMYSRNCTLLQRWAGACAGREKEADLPARRIVKLLIDARAFYDIESAILLDDLERVRALLKEDPTRANRGGVVHFTTMNNRAAIAQLLLEYKADFANAYWEYTPAVCYALKHPEMVRLYLRAGFDPKVPLKYQKWTGARSGLPWPEAEDKITLLHCAAGGGHLEATKILLEAGAPVDARTARDDTPLVWAARAGQTEMVRLLLKHKASAEGKDGARAMAAAARRIRPRDFENLRKWNASCREVIGVLYVHGVPYDLFTAIAVGDAACVKTLLKEKPALAASKDDDGPHVLMDSPRAVPALHRATELGQTEVVALLLEAGAPVNEKDSAEDTALHHAADWGREEIVRLLIRHKGDVNAISNGRTPLHVAASSEKRSASAVARLLLDAGARVNAKDGGGRTPLSRAKESRRTDSGDELVMLLQERGGKE
jgi:ankyrin repeat protein